MVFYGVSKAEWLGSWAGDVVGFFRELPGKIAGFEKDLGTTFVSKPGEGLADLGQRLIDWIRTPINAIISAWNALGIPSFHVGIPMPGPVPDVSLACLRGSGRWESNPQTSLEG